jgi:hypothetical protein
LIGARTVSVRSAFDRRSANLIFKAFSSLPAAASRDGSRSNRFKRYHYRSFKIFLATSDVNGAAKDKKNPGTVFPDLAN